MYLLTSHFAQSLDYYTGINYAYVADATANRKVMKCTKPPKSKQDPSALDGSTAARVRYDDLIGVLKNGLFHVLAYRLGWTPSSPYLERDRRER